jgi:hypothetical protein
MQELSQEETPPLSNEELAQTPNAKIWAREFMKTVENKDIEIDEDFMEGWFGAAIMAGWDELERRVKGTKTIDAKQ